MDESKYEVDEVTSEIILKNEPFIYIPVKETTLDLDTKNEAICTLFNHLERDFKTEDG